MSEKPIQFHQEFAENPYVAFDSDGEGVSRVFDVVWDFHALNQNAKTLSFAYIDEKYRQGIQSYLYLLMQWQKKNSSSGSHAAVSSLKSNRNMLNALAVRLGEGNFDLLSNEREWKRCSKKLEGYGSESVCQHLASLINTLNRANLVKRYVQKREWTRWIRSDARTRQAVALPEAIHVNILKTVVQFVETYHPYRHQIANAMEKFYLYHDEMFNAELNKLGVKTLNDRQMKTFLKRMSTRTRKWPERTVIPEFSFDRRGAWLGKLLRICFICVGLFSAARKEELLSMNKDSYDDTLATVPKVSGFSTKGNKGEKIFTTWNTAPIAKLALELSFDATQAARKYCQQRLNDFFHNGRLTKDRYNARSQELESTFISSDMSFDSEVLVYYNPFLSQKMALGDPLIYFVLHRLV
ncbi:hypothetical protein [Vibrio sp. 10N.247.310.34]|uniref:hypothetical protein n=1 Tax=Vibrio sp. 10N.247.310.34 TaxID=3229982 RepID=UPI00354C16F2